MSANECDGKVALVTGASRGIGAAIAERLASAGAVVAVAARSLDHHRPELPGTLQETVARIEGRGGRAVAIRCDIMNADSREEAVARCREMLGPVDVLVNNAAIGLYKPFESFTDRDLALTFEANVRAPSHFSQMVIPGMRAKGRGWILNISSATAEHPNGPPYIDWEQRGGHHLYAASKAALGRLTTGLAAELQTDGICANVLAPVAAVLTPGVRAIGAARWLDASMVEPVEAMAEAALALSCCPPELTGRIAYSVPLLEELQRPIRTLDGEQLFRAT